MQDFDHQKYLLLVRVLNSGHVMTLKVMVYIAYTFRSKSPLLRLFRYIITTMTTATTTMTTTRITTTTAMITGIVLLGLLVVGSVIGKRGREEGGGGWEREGEREGGREREGRERERERELKET